MKHVIEHRKAENFARKIIFTLIIFVVIVSAFFSFSALVEASGWSVLTPKMILRVNFTEEKIITNTIGVKNLDNVSVQVKLEVKGDLENITKLDEYNVTLPPEEEKWVNFTVELPKPGDYIGEIISFFSAESRQPAGLSSQIIIFATGEEVKSAEEKESEEYTGSVSGKAISILNNPAAFTFMLSLLLILFIVILLIYRKRKKNR